MVLLWVSRWISHLLMIIYQESLIYKMSRKMSIYEQHRIIGLIRHFYSENRKVKRIKLWLLTSCLRMNILVRSRESFRPNIQRREKKKNPFFEVGNPRRERRPFCMLPVYCFTTMKK